jgi:hypothetical protein
LVHRQIEAELHSTTKESEQFKFKAGSQSQRHHPVLANEAMHGSGSAMVMRSLLPVDFHFSYYVPAGAAVSLAGRISSSC